MSKPIYFISDLHLNENEPEIAKGFIRFLREQIGQTEALYILGDFFEAWIGDDAASALDKEVIDELARATSQGLPIYFIHGNRDFLIGKCFARKTGITRLKDPSLITISGEKWLISHGDYLCTDDHSHMKLRKFTENRLLRFIFLSLPISLRKKIAKKFRGESEQHKKRQRMDIMDVNKEMVNSQLRLYHVSQLIHGHTHEGKIHNFILDNKPAIRIVLSDWHETAKILRFVDGAFSMDIIRT
jgi:UDP-2,3-diacylglucosamine hydrolase